MTKFTLLTAAALVAFSSAAMAGANNPTLGETIAAKWNSQTARDSWDAATASKDEAKAEPMKKAKKKGKKKKAAAKAAK